MNKESQKSWPLVGNRKISDFLEKSLAAGKLAGAYIFYGPKDLGKTAAAMFFAKTLLCHRRQDNIFAAPCGKCSSCQSFMTESKSQNLETAHSDLHILKKNSDKKNISVEETREFIRELSLSSFSGGYKVGIIKEADSLNQESANALLKTLEEPRPKVVIILTVSRLDILPKTIISRSQVLRFAPVDFSEICDFLITERNFSRDAALRAAKLSLGRPALAAKFAENSDFHNDYTEAVDCFLGFFKGGIFKRLKNIDSLLASKNSASGAAEKTLNIISIWRGVARDLLLISVSSGNLAQNYNKLTDLEEVGQKYQHYFWPGLIKKIDLAEEYVRANVNPRLALEGIAIGI